MYADGNTSNPLDTGLYCELLMCQVHQYVKHSVLIYTLQALYKFQTRQLSTLWSDQWIVFFHFSYSSIQTGELVQPIGYI